MPAFCPLSSATLMTVALSCWRFDTSHPVEPNRMAKDNRDIMCVRKNGSTVAILSLGPRLAEAMKAAEELAARGISATVADARFAKPMDTALIELLARKHEVLVTIEEGSAGGFGSAVMQHLAWAGLLDGQTKIRPMVLPDRFVDHDSPAKQMIEVGLTAKDIVATVTGALTKQEAARA